MICWKLHLLGSYRRIATVCVALDKKRLPTSDRELAFFIRRPPCLPRVHAQRGGKKSRPHPNPQLLQLLPLHPFHAAPDVREVDRLWWVNVSLQYCSGTKLRNVWPLHSARHTILLFGNSGCICFGWAVRFSRRYECSARSKLTERLGWIGSGGDFGLFSCINGDFERVGSMGVEAPLGELRCCEFVHVVVSEQRIVMSGGDTGL